MPPHPHQRQNDKACHRRGFDQLQHRSKQHICRVPRLCGHSQHDAYGHAQPKPSRMRPELNPTRCQNSACGKSCKRVRTACTGETRNTSCPTAMAAHCHTASQKAAAPSR